MIIDSMLSLSFACQGSRSVFTLDMVISSVGGTVISFDRNLI